MTDYNINNINDYDNIAEKLDDKSRRELADQLIEIYNADEISGEKNREKIKKIVKLAKMMGEEKNYPFPKASNVIMPIIAEAAIGFGSTAYPGIIRDDSIVIPKIIGNDNGKPVLNQNGEPMINEDGTPKMQDVGIKQERGERVAEFMNWQLFENIDNWQEEVRKLCYCLPIVGTLFKKIFYDILNKKVSATLIFPDKIIVNAHAKGDRYTTVTEIIDLSKQEVKEKIRTGIYLEVDYFKGSEEEEYKDRVIPGEGVEDKIIDIMETYEFLEIHCWVDLDNDGLGEPYIITMSRDTKKIARIVARFTKDDITTKDGVITYIKCEEYLVKYGFIPSFDGGYFDIGYGQLLFDHNNAINSSINQLLDAGHLKNAGGGLISRGIRLKGGAMRFKPGEFLYADVSSGQSLKENIVNFPFGEPSSTLFQLMDYLVQSAMRLSSISKILKGDIPANLPAETIPAVINEAGKAFKATYKSIFFSIKKELKLIFKINKAKLEEETYRKVLNDDSADKEKDFDEELINIVPVADPESIIDIQRVAKAAVLMTLKDDPYINQEQIRKDLLKSYNINNTEDYVFTPEPPPPLPNPLAEVEQIKLEGKKLELQIKEKELQIKANELKMQLMIKVEKEKVDIGKAIAETGKIEAETEKIEAETGEVGKNANV